MAMGTSWAEGAWAEGAWADGSWADLGSGGGEIEPAAYPAWQSAVMVSMLLLYLIGKQAGL